MLGKSSVTEPHARPPLVFTFERQVYQGLTHTVKSILMCGQ
jgi:hypothetical protein